MGGAIINLLFLFYYSIKISQSQIKVELPVRLERTVGELQSRVLATSLRQHIGGPTPIRTEDQAVMSRRL